ncbi:MAG: hypothetical protein QME07_06060 [bacterium]|nr:hypothetical protein [bacterium]
MKRLLALAVSLVIGCEVSVPEYNQVANLTQITSEKGMNILPDISSDGKEMAFSSNRRGNFDIFIKKPEEQAVIQRTFGREDDLFPSWSSDGKMLAFSSNRFGSFDIFIIDAFSGHDTRQITFDSTDEIAPDWSPDGKNLVFTRIRRGDENSYSIIIVDVETGIQTELTNGLFPKFSPDGNRICFQRGIEEGKQSIWIINSDGTMETEIVYNPIFSAVTPSWSIDGERIVYASAMNGKGKVEKGLIEELVAYRPIDIRTVKTNGSNDTQITGDSGPDGFPVWSPDGFIYFCSLREAREANDEYNINIFRMRLQSLP